MEINKIARNSFEILHAEASAGLKRATESEDWSEEEWQRNILTGTANLLASGCNLAGQEPKDPESAHEQICRELRRLTIVEDAPLHTRESLFFQLKHLAKKLESER